MHVDSLSADRPAAVTRRRPAWSPWCRHRGSGGRPVLVVVGGPARAARGARRPLARRSASPAGPARSSGSHARRRCRPPLRGRCRPRARRPTRELDPEALRRAAGRRRPRALAGTATVRAGAAAGAATRGRCAPSPRARCSAPTPSTATAPPRRGRPAPVEEIVVVLDAAGRRDGRRRRGARRGRRRRASALARDLVNTPPGRPAPAALRRAPAEAAARRGPSTSRCSTRRRCAEGGYGGILGVGQGSARPPRLVRLDATRRRARAGTLALVGKGITFDSGGLSLKPAGGMEAMKSDMAGAAAVLAAVVAIARLELPVEGRRLAADAPRTCRRGTAIRPVRRARRMYGGRTVEVLNTDAEGRLVLGRRAGRGPARSARRGRRRRDPDRRADGRARQPDRPA